MQWVEVAQAEEIEKFRPLILNQVARVAEAPELMALGTAKGPTRLGPRSLAMWAASTIALVEGPPEPTMRPVFSLEISASSRPASALACSIAMWPKAVPWARNRAARRSTMLSHSMAGAAWTCERKPSSAYSGAALTPDLASRSEARTSLALFPIDETMPIPVTTTRRMLRSLPLIEADAQILSPVDGLAVSFQHPVADAHDQAAVDDPLHLDLVGDLLDRGRHLAAELHLAATQRPAAALAADPAEVEADQLPRS